MRRSRWGSLSYRFFHPVELAYWAGILTVVVVAWVLPFNTLHNWYIGVASLLVSVVGLAWFRWGTPQHGYSPPTAYFIVSIVLGAAALATYLLDQFDVRMDVFFVSIVVCVGIIAPRRFTLIVVILTAACEIAISLLLDGLSLLSVASMGLKAAILIALGPALNGISGRLVGQAMQAEDQNRHLSMLLQTSNLSMQIDDLQQMLTQIARAIALNVPITACRISVLSSDRKSLITYGAYPILPLEPDEVGIGKSYDLEQLPYLEEVCASGQPRILYEQEIQPLTQEQDGPAFFYHGTQTLILIPLNTPETCVGLLSVGEPGIRQGDLFDDEKMHLLQTLVNGITSAIQSSLVLGEARRQAQRLSVANEIGKAISATIELDNLLELIYQELKKAIPSDTYYVALYREEQQVLDMHLLIDEDMRFPPKTISLDQGLSSWVLRNRRGLLVHNLLDEWASLPVQPVVLGTERSSISWLGAPMLANDRILGVLAIASYKVHAFDEDDQMLLNNVAAQAALAIDNANQHAQVKEQARRDSLTGAYNHGHLLHLLQEAVDQDPLHNAPVSLIMLDIDFFKQYNDRYGHAVGDAVLCQLVEAIQGHVKKTDIVGRWGGEEFAVGLPNANTSQALAVAQRIRQTLAATVIQDKHDRPIPSPTVSQGIATFPDHASASAELVDVADEALYRAKNAGRDQIAVAG